MHFDVLPKADEITQEFGCTDDASEWWAPWCPEHRFHSGIDLGSTHGGWSIFKAPVFATRAGTVVRVGFPNGLGDQAVFLRLDQGGWLIYGHLEQALCSVGQHVGPGQVIGLLGTRGNSTAPHLHLEYRIDGPLQNVDGEAAGVGNPAPFLYAVPVPPTLPAGWSVEDLGGSFAPGGGLTSQVLADGSLHIFGIGADTHLWHWWYRA